MYETKGDIINQAYSKLRISGKTKIPDASDIELAIGELELIANEIESRNLCTGFNFEEEPDPASKHGLDRKYVAHYAAILAARLMPDFGKGSAPDPLMIQRASVAWSTIASLSMVVKTASYPSRMPIGSGNRRCYFEYSDFYVPEATPPTSSESKYMAVGEIDDFTENFDSYLGDGEDVASYTITADTGLTIVSDSLATPVVSYRIQADSAVTLATVVIVITTSTGRIKSRTINFSVAE